MLVNETKYLQNPKVTKIEENFALKIFILWEIFYTGK